MEPEGRAEASAYIQERILFVPRFLWEIARYRPEIAERFADYYNQGKQDRALSRKTKELVFLAVAVAFASPACLIHVEPAMGAGATREEVVEAALVGAVGSLFVSGGPGFPRAVEYLEKVISLEAEHRQGYKREYAAPPAFRM